VALAFDLTAAAALGAVALAWMFTAGVLRPRLRPREAEVVVEGRAIELRGAGRVSQRITAKDVVAAATGHADAGALVALVRGSPADRPIVLQLPNERDAARVRRALGIGAHGFGTVSWPVFSDTESRTSEVVRFAAAAGWVGVAAATLQERVEVALGGVFFMMLASVVAVAWIASGRVRNTRPTAEERAHVSAMARSAEPLARPAAVPVPVAPLARADTESHVSWLQRLDAMAASLGRSEGYRGAGVDRVDLWEALEDPDALASVRAASARLLARIAPDEARTRIADTLAVERDGETRARIRVALEDDVEIAARGLDRLTPRGTR
jgi:hypothetical protein